MSLMAERVRQLEFLSIAVVKLPVEATLFLLILKPLHVNFVQ